MNSKDTTIVFSVIVPCYNEGQSIPIFLRKFYDAMSKWTISGIELILVNNNSTDATVSILVQELGRPDYGFARTVFESQAGYGAALKRGLSSARGTVIAWTHADLQSNPEDVFRAYDEYKNWENHKVIVKGNRVGRPLSQVIFSAGMACIASVILRKKFFEINAQPKLFPVELSALLQNGPDDYSFDLYFLYHAKRLQYSIRTIDVHFEDRLYGESKWAYSFSSRIKTIGRTIKYILGMRGL